MSEQNQTVEMTPDENERKTIGTLVGFMNKAAGTNLSVKQAMASQEFMAFYRAARNAATVLQPRLPANARSTRRRSYESLNIPPLDRQVLDAIKANPNSTREALAFITGRKLSTICGAVTRLLDNDKIFVSGEELNVPTGKHHETLAAYSEAK